MNGNGVSTGDWIRRVRLHEAGIIDQRWKASTSYLRFPARTGISPSLRGKADPSDLLRETFLKSYQHFGQFGGQSEVDLTARGSCELGGCPPGICARLATRPAASRFTSGPDLEHFGAGPRCGRGESHRVTTQSGQGGIQVGPAA